jgi:hypothetical protein
LLKTLNDLTKDRILKVQTAAKESLKRWHYFQKMNDEKEVGKMKKEFDGDADELLKMRLGESVGLLGSGEIVQSKVTGGAGLRREASKKSKNFMSGLGGSSVQDSLEFGMVDKNRRIQKNFTHDSNSPGKYKNYKNYKNHLYENPNDDSLDRALVKGLSNYKEVQLTEKTDLKQRAHDFLQKRTGSGGGFIKDIDISTNKRNARPCYERQREHFKDQIMRDRVTFSRQRRGKKDFELLRDTNGEPLINLTNRQIEGLQTQQRELDYSKLPHVDERVVYEESCDLEYSRRSNKFSNHGPLPNSQTSPQNFNAPQPQTFAQDSEQPFAGFQEEIPEEGDQMMPNPKSPINILKGPYNPNQSPNPMDTYNQNLLQSTQLFETTQNFSNHPQPHPQPTNTKQDYLADTLQYDATQDQIHYSPPTTQ